MYAGEMVSTAAAAMLSGWIAERVIDTGVRVRGIAPLALSGSVLADNTAVFAFDPITPGASYSTASGVTFASIPEPGSLVLVAFGAGLTWAATAIEW